MIKLIVLAIFLVFLPISKALAESSASVNINNNINSSSTNNSEFKSRTEITVETDGEVTHYESDQPGNVTVKSINGKSEITVDDEKVTPNPTKTSEEKQTPAPTITPTVSKEIEEEIKGIRTIIEDLKEKITSLKESLSSLFD